MMQRQMFSNPCPDVWLWLSLPSPQELYRVDHIQRLCPERATGILSVDKKSCMGGVHGELLAVGVRDSKCLIFCVLCVPCIVHRQPPTKRIDQQS